MQLAVHQWGAGPRVVLVHGGGAPSRETWRAQKPLSERWRLIAPDRPGHGDSPGDRNDFALDADLLVERFFPFIGVPLPTPEPFPDWLKRGAEAIDLGISPTRAQLPLAELRGSGVPMMVVSGGHHPCHEAICDAIAHATSARREQVPGFGHLVPAVGDAFNTLLEEFWGSVEAP